MKKVGRKEALLLMLPVLALTGFGVLFRAGKPTLTLEKAQISHKRYANGVRYSIVNVTLKYNDPSLFNRLFKDKNREGPNLKETEYFLIDQKGEQHQISKFGMWGSQLAPTAQQRYDVLVDIPTGKIPQSLGKLTLATEFSTVNGAELPFSIRVRDKANENKS